MIHQPSLGSVNQHAPVRAAGAIRSFTLARRTSRLCRVEATPSHYPHPVAAEANGRVEIEVEAARRPLKVPLMFGPRPRSESREVGGPEEQSYQLMRMPALSTWLLAVALTSPS
jgi:hypothetical protein